MLGVLGNPPALRCRQAVAGSLFLLVFHKCPHPAPLAPSTPAHLSLPVCQKQQHRLVQPHTLASLPSSSSRSGAGSRPQAVLGQRIHHTPAIAATCGPPGSC